MKLQTLGKETATQVFFCEIYKIFKKTYFEKHLEATAFASWQAEYSLLIPIIS